MINETNLVTAEILELTNSISHMMNGTRFISLTYRSKSANELARHTLLAGFSYLELVKRSIEELTQWGDYVDHTALAGQAYREVMDSLRETLTKHQQGEQNSAYTKKGMYAHVRGGVNINLNDNSIQFFGLSIAKKVIEPGIYKKVNSKPLTIEKDKFRSELPLAKFREFALDKNVVLSGKVNGEVFECADVNEVGIEINPTVNQPVAA